MSNKTALRVPFNVPFATGKESEYIQQAIANNHLSGDGAFSLKCHEWLEKRTGALRALLTHSGTAALEMCGILLNIKTGDEVIMPSYTFVSTANAFVLRGAVPVFVDISEDTLNINPQRIESAITSKTVAIVVVHYAGVSCDMDAICEIGKRHNIPVIEDAAHSMLATFKDRPLGSFGQLAALSFHETKNLICGEGGALLINDPALVERAEIIREKGTNRKQFFRGLVDKYSWVDIGSSFLPSELEAAFLWAQMEEAESITSNRMESWQKYHGQLSDLEERGYLRRPIIPDSCGHNAHLYYILAKDLQQRLELQEYMKNREISCIPHYVPLHSSKAGAQFGRAAGSLAITDSIADRLLRLPLWVGMSEEAVNLVCYNLHQYFAPQV